MNYSKVNDFFAKLKFKKPPRKKDWVFFLIFVSFVLIIFFGSFWYISYQKIIPGIFLNNFSLGSKTIYDAKKLLDSIQNDFQQIVIEVNGESVILKNFLILEQEEILKEAWQYGHRQNPFISFYEIFTIGRQPKFLKPKWALNLDSFNQQFKEKITPLFREPKNAELKISFLQGEPRFEIIQEENGFQTEGQSILQQILEQAEKLDNKPIQAPVTFLEPKIKKAEIEMLLPEIQEIFKQKFFLFYQEQKTQIFQEELASWLEIKKATSTYFDFNEEKIAQTLTNIAKKIEHPPRDARLVLNEEKTRALDFFPGEKGEALPLQKNIQIIKKALRNKEPNIYLFIEEKSDPKIVLKDTNQLGIEEIIGVGKTNFKGSPPNRIKNIKRGAELLNWLVIKPGEEFSLLSKLRPFTKENGYFEELVIKPAKQVTEPEIGGGLCQVATTMFRLALNSGLPITARTNHSYRVSYYEPPVGMDATVYDPAPDFKFVNDTGSYLLLTTEVKGFDLIFTFWGKKDGRKIEMTDPIVKNIIPPPPIKIIETTELKPGEKKCTEKPHYGADTEFLYKVIYPDGTIFEKKFKSHYQPWQEVCYIGVKP